MKKCLLGALFVLGTMAYAQENKVVTAVVDGKATANLGIEVTGKVFDPTDLSLIVDIKSAAAAGGTGFSFTMPNMMAGVEDVKTAQGDFEISVQKTNAGVAKKYPLKGLEVKLIQGGTPTENATTEAADMAGTAKGITLAYNLIGGSTAPVGTTTHVGAVAVKATSATGSTAGTYSDTSVQLRVSVTGQDEPTEA